VERALAGQVGAVGDQPDVPFHVAVAAVGVSTTSVIRGDEYQPVFFGKLGPCTHRADQLADVGVHMADGIEVDDVFG